MKRVSFLLAGSAIMLVLIFLVLSSCSKNPYSSNEAQNPITPLFKPAVGNLNGSAGNMPAYYDSTLFTINFMELSSQAEKSILAHNNNFNIIYQSDPGLPGGKPFISVIDAIPGDGFNPLWREVQIQFNQGFTPRQLFSDDEILAAAAGTNPEITLLPTDEVYRCSVVGQKPGNLPPLSDPSGPNMNGSGGDMPAYYDSVLFTINFKEFPSQAEKSILAHNKGFNIIYQSDPGLPGGNPFISVIDAIPGDGFNPLWREVQIRFNEGFTPRQLFSDDEILAASKGTNPEIILLPTDEVYRCSVVGKKGLH